MNKNGPIILIEDDLEDQEIWGEIFKELNYPNEILFFSDGHGAFEFLTATKEKPFIILSDINMPKLSGFELRDKIHNNEELRLKCIPYLFFTTAADEKHVIEAYSKSIQGFFTKPASYQETRTLLKSIIEYWQKCHSPNVTM
ncbi:MAG: histidine kinase [Ferruginibacter sp.]|nr:histidine kinase [Ferruginibacter sp.]